MPAINIPGSAGGYCAEGCAEDPTRGSSPRILEDQENYKNNCEDAEARVESETSLRYILSMVGDMEGSLKESHTQSQRDGECSARDWE